MLHSYLKIEQFIILRIQAPILFGNPRKLPYKSLKISYPDFQLAPSLPGSTEVETNASGYENGNGTRDIIEYVHLTFGERHILG